MERILENDGALCSEQSSEDKSRIRQSRADNKSENKGESRNKEAIDMIIRSIDRLQYGTITITIHNGSIVQVETNTKQRFG